MAPDADKGESFFTPVIHSTLSYTDGALSVDNSLAATSSFYLRQGDKPLLDLWNYRR
jgi:hypothetical protein